jgi:hypothetical protein
MIFNMPQLFNAAVAMFFVFQACCPKILKKLFSDNRPIETTWHHHEARRQPVL